MTGKQFVKSAKHLLEPFCVTKGKKFRLADIDPGDTLKFKGEDKPKAKEALALSVEALSALQDKLYADDRWAVLLIFQAMDAAGKDSTIKHVLSGVNPQGVQVVSFKKPSVEELAHDFLWRTTRALPERGRIGVFNRSYYEEVLVVRVHPDILASQHLPAEISEDDKIWKHRYTSIRDFEKHVHRNGTRVVKFFLHVSKE